jgi:outer membrane protein OmpA-like peptidoglycan-associated protein
MSKTYARPLAMAALTMVLAVGAAGCQTMSDLDPTGLLGSDETPAETQFPTDSQEQAAADASTTTPDLASIPARPPAPNTAAQAATTQQVASAGAQAQYSADALRAGTDAAAPPPTAADATAARQALASADVPPSADAPPTAQAAAADAPPTADAPPSAGSDLPPTAGAPMTRAAASPAPARSGNPAVPPRMRTASAAPPPAAAEPPAAAPPSAAPSAEPPSAAPSVTAQAPTLRAPVASASLAPPPTGEPAVPAVPATAGSRLAMNNPSDAQLGFKQSSAPALAPGVSNWVSPPVLAHYRQTAAQAGSAGVSSAAVPAVAGRGDIASAGDVRANLGGVPGTPAGMAAAMNGGAPPAAIVYFPGDGINLSKTALAEVRQTVLAFKATGGTGSIKVVGHASSRTPNMTVERHLELIFQKSQARANAVAQALIRAGVPAAKVQIEAVGDSQPIYYESMPKGEDGNRRAEIFLQG